MNQYTWDAAPRGKGMLKVVTFGKNHDEAQERAKLIVRDVWKAVFEANPEHEIVGLLNKVEEIDTRTHIKQVFHNYPKDSDDA